MDLLGRGKRKIQELISFSLARNTGRSLPQSWGITKDFGTTDYVWWDRARRGKVKGLEISGLLLKPLYSKVASWVMGRPPMWRLPNNESFQEDLNKWWERNYPDIMRAFKESLALADCYLLINPDMTAAVIPPNQVIPIRDQIDPTIVVGYKIVEKFKHPDVPTLDVTITDEFLPFSRRRVIEHGQVIVSNETFSNLIGEVPIVPIYNIQGADEEFGKPEAEPLIPAMFKYGELFSAGAEGNIRQGRPTPVIDQLGDANAVQKFMDKYAKRRSRTDIETGETVIETNLEINLDEVIILGDAARFHYESPASSSGDLRELLKVLFFLYVQYTEVPEFILGVSVSSTKASTEEQIEPFVKWLEMRRGLNLKWMLPISRIVLKMLALRRPEVLPDFEDIDVPKWRKMITEDGRLTLDTLAFLVGEGAITLELANRLAPVDIPDPDNEVAAAQEQWRSRKEFENSLKTAPSPDNPASTNLNGRNDNSQGNSSTRKPSGQTESRANGNVRTSPTR